MRSDLAAAINEVTHLTGSFLLRSGATALSLHTGLPVAFVRKKAKEYGTQRLAEGADVAGRRVLVVEDVVTSAGQVVLSTQDLRVSVRTSPPRCA